MRALANITAERMKTMREALLSNMTSFLTKNWPQNPATTETAVRYRAARPKWVCDYYYHQAILFRVIELEIRVFKLTLDWGLDYNGCKLGVTLMM